MDCLQMGHFLKFAILFMVTMFINYYIIVFAHEWSHSTMAWIFGYKNSIFDIQYGGWLMLHVDEMVPYDSMIANGDGIKAALTGISGITSNTILFLISMLLLNRTKILQNKFYLLFIYSSLIMNLMPIVGYIPANTFTTHGDVGRFLVGMSISALWVFCIGTPLVVLAIIYIFRNAIFKVYQYYPLKNIVEQSFCLFMSLVFLFLPLFIHGQNPFTDRYAAKYSSMIFPVVLFAAVPLLLIVCFPTRKWVKNRL